MAEHTPGPWRVCKEYHNITVVGCNGERIAYPLVANLDDDAMHANSRLIAAAPELLAAMKRVLEWLVEDSCGYDPYKSRRCILCEGVWREAWAVVAKVDGRP